jgi:hypothetical protein
VLGCPWWIWNWYNERDGDMMKVKLVTRIVIGAIVTKMRYMTSYLALFISLNILISSHLAQSRWFNFLQALHENRKKMQNVSSCLSLFLSLNLVTWPDLAQMMWFNMHLTLYDIVWHFDNISLMTSCLYFFVYLNLVTWPDLAQFRWFNFCMTWRARCNSMTSCLSSEFYDLAQTELWKCDVKC